MVHYVMHHFAMTTETSALLSPELPWRVRQAQFDAAFPPDSSNIVVVVDGLTPELSEAAAAKLAAALSTQSTLFRAIQRPDSGPFWAHNGLLFASIQEVKTAIAELLKSQPLLGSMASDPSLRGLTNTLSLAMRGLNDGQVSPEQLRAPIRSLSDALQSLSDGRPSFFSWRTLICGHEPDKRELRRFILVDPVLDFTQLQPGQLPLDAIRTTAKRLQLDAAHGVSVRLTGPVPLQDERIRYAGTTRRFDRCSWHRGNHPDALVRGEVTVADRVNLGDDAGGSADGDRAGTRAFSPLQRHIRRLHTLYSSGWEWISVSSSACAIGQNAEPQGTCAQLSPRQDAPWAPLSHWRPPRSVQGFWHLHPRRTTARRNSE